MTCLRNGFTLVELLITVVILGILAGLALSGFDEIRRRAHVSSLRSDLRVLSIHQELYHQDHQHYADTYAVLEFAPSDQVDLNVNFADAEGWAATATHMAMTGLQCGLYVGAAPANQAAPATMPGVIACE